MKGSHCRLYDENLVRNIMISTGVSILEFIRENKTATVEDVCDFVEYNADDIISETIKNINTTEEAASEERKLRGSDDDDMSFFDGDKEEPSW